MRIWRWFHEGPSQRRWALFWYAVAYGLVFMGSFDLMAGMACGIGLMLGSESERLAEENR